MLLTTLPSQNYHKYHQKKDKSIAKFNCGDMAAPPPLCNAEMENCARLLVLSIPRLFYSPMLRPSYNPNDPGHDPRGRTEELT